MRLDQAILKQSYVVHSLEKTQQDLFAKLTHFGFFPGARVCINQLAPIFKDPLLVEVEGSTVAISRAYARLIQIEEAE